MKLLSLALIALTLSACSEGSNEAQSSRAEVRIQTFAFTPGSLRVGSGDAVTFRNSDDILHTVTSGKPERQGVPGVSKDRPARPDGLFDAELELDDTFVYTFDRAGTYVYYCDIHSGMRGKVIVN